LKIHPDRRRIRDFPMLTNRDFTRLEALPVDPLSSPFYAFNEIVY
jgi:hypothetical protein